MAITPAITGHTMKGLQVECHQQAEQQVNDLSRTHEAAKNEYKPYFNFMLYFSKSKLLKCLPLASQFINADIIK